jgi:hypothetical protein
MTMSPGPRKFALTVHIASSVGWSGAVIAFIGLTAFGLSSQDAQVARIVYLAAEPITWLAIVPLAVASLLTGIVQSLGTPWGLFRHYWVLFKLVLTVLATIVLLMYTQTVSYFAVLAAETGDVQPGGLRNYLFHSSAALLVLLVTTALSVYKPRAMTPYGLRKAREEPAES